MGAGRRLTPLPPLDELRERFRDEFAQLDARYKTIEHPDTYPVGLSPQLHALKVQVERERAEAEVIREHPRL